MKEFYKNKSTINVSNDLLKLKDISLNTSFIEPRCFNNPLKLAKLWLSERSFLFRNVPFITFDKLNKIINKSPDLIMKDVDLISFLCIPILHVKERKSYGCFTPIYLEKTIDDYELVFTEIRLNNKNSVFISLIYLHEIIHTVVENNDYSITNYIDYELLPILFEFLLANDLGDDVFHFNVSYRINQISNYVNMLSEDDLLTRIYASSYLNSIIIAYELAYIYSDGKTKVKKDFLNDLKSILNEKNNVYWMLEKYNIDYNSALDKLIGRRKLECKI